MSLNHKKFILIQYFREHGMPKGFITIDSDTCEIGNVSVNGEYYGTFDYNLKKFVQTE